MITSILFDCYGTLINTGNGSIKATEQILALNNSSINPLEFYNKWKIIHHEICATEPFMSEAIAFSVGLDKLYKAYSIDGNPERDVSIMLETLGKREIYPEVREVFNRLSKKYLLAVGSNSDHNPLINDLSRNKLNVNDVYSSESLRIYKPNGEFFKRILKDLSVKLEEVIYVGDSQIDDIKGPSELGIPSIWINRRNERINEGIPIPKLECKDLRGILTYFDC
jgi:2-haloalkanoic acid dehalogenase type II